MYFIIKHLEMEVTEQNKDIIEYYLSLNVQQHFGIDIDLKDEFTFTENIVSKKIIIASTFSEKILSKPEIKEFLSGLISDINNDIQPRKRSNLDDEPMKNVV